MTIQIDFETDLPPANEPTRPAKKTRPRAPRASRARRASRYDSCDWSSYVDEDGNVHHESRAREW